jgi:hypothetical protein
MLELKELVQYSAGQPYHKSVLSKCLTRRTDLGHLLVYLSIINSSELF